MYCTWESIDTDHRPQTTDDDGRHTLNLYYYLKGSTYRTWFRCTTGGFNILQFPYQLVFSLAWCVCDLYVLWTEVTQ